MAEAKTEFRSVKFITPRSVLVFPRVNEPDTKFKPEGEYSSKVRVDRSAFDAVMVGRKPLIEALEAMRDELLEETKGKLKDKIKELKAAKKAGAAKKIEEQLASLEAVDVIKVELDEETGEETSNYLFNAKMKASGKSKKTGKEWKRKPPLFDAKGNKIAKPPAVWGGTEAKVAIEAFPYYAPNDGKVGIAFKLESLQILKLVSGSGQSASDYGFGEEDGYEADASSGSDDDSGDDSSDSSDDADF